MGRPFGGYSPARFGDQTGFRCRCGHEYLKLDRRFVRRLPDGTLEPYMVWKLFRGYVPDGAGSEPR